MAAPTSSGAENSTTSTSSTTSSNYGNAPLSSSTAHRSDVRGFTAHYGNGVHRPPPFFNVPITRTTTSYNSDTHRPTITSLSTMVQVISTNQGPVTHATAPHAVQYLSSLSADTQPAPTQPAPTQPAPTQPAPTQLAPTQPAPTQPAQTQPAPTQPAQTQPAPTQPAPIQPAPIQPAPIQPALIQTAISHSNQNNQTTVATNPTNGVTLRFPMSHLTQRGTSQRLVTGQISMQVSQKISGQVSGQVSQKISGQVSGQSDKHQTISQEARDRREETRKLLQRHYPGVRVVSTRSLIEFEEKLRFNEQLEILQTNKFVLRNGVPVFIVFFSGGRSMIAVSKCNIDDSAPDFTDDDSDDKQHSGRSEGGSNAPSGSAQTNSQSSQLTKANHVPGTNGMQAHNSGDTSTSNSQSQDDNPPSVASSKCDSSSDVQDMKERMRGKRNRTSESDDDNSDDDNCDDDNCDDFNSDDHNSDSDNGDNEMNENRANDNDSKNETDNRKGSKRRRHESDSDDEMEGNTSHRKSKLPPGKRGKFTKPSPEKSQSSGHNGQTSTADITSSTPTNTRDRMSSDGDHATGGNRRNSNMSITSLDNYFYCGICKTPIMETGDCENPLVMHRRTPMHKDIKAQLALGKFLHEKDLPQQLGADLGSMFKEMFDDSDIARKYGMLCHVSTDNYPDLFPKKKKKKTTPTVPKQICMKYFEGMCTDIQCKLLHTNKTYAWLTLEPGQGDKPYRSLPALVNEHLELQFTSSRARCLNFREDERLNVVDFDKMTYNGTPLVRVTVPPESQHYKPFNWYYRETQKSQEHWIMSTVKGIPIGLVIGDCKRLEELYQEDSQQIKIIQTKLYKCELNMATMTLKNLTVNTEGLLELERRPVVNDKSKLTCLPYWDPIPDDGSYFTNEIKLDKHNICHAEDYMKIEKWIKMTLQVKVVRVTGIQNTYLWGNYIRKRNYLTHVNGAPPKETLLMHGTKKTSIRSIIENGFDPRVSGSSNGTRYGRGIYMARDAALAYTYVKENTMLVSRVLVGESAVGDSSYVTPPSKDDDDPGAGRYDSCVDNVDNPQVYVLFDRDQCYPVFAVEYIV